MEGTDRGVAAETAGFEGERDGGSEAFFRAILGSVSAPVFALDESGTVVFANAGVEEVLGYAPVRLTGKPLSTLVPERFGHYHALTDVLTDEDVTDLDGATFEMPAIHRDGDRLRLSVSFAARECADRTLLVGTVMEASQTEGERSETGHEAEMAQYERIIETMNDGIYVLDGSFTITNVNQAVVSMTGYSREELIGAHASLLASEDLLQQAAEQSAEMLESRRETATIVSEIVRKDGRSLPIETRFSLYSFEDDSYGQLGVIRDISDRKQFEATLRALHSSTRELLATESKPDVSTLVADTATDVLDLDGAVVYRIDTAENVLRPTATSNRTDVFTGPLPVLEPDDSPLWRVFVEGERELIDGSVADTGLPVENGLVVPLGDHGVFVAGTADRAAIDDDTETLVGLLAASAEEALSRLDREIDIRERDRRLEEQNRRLWELDRVNAIIREIDQSLVEAESIDEIGDAVCDRLVASDRFAFAWFGEPNTAEGTITPRSWSGDGLGYLDDVGFSLEQPEEPAATATVSGEQTVVSDVAADLKNGEWRKAALSREYQSVISIPLTHGDITHGVLTVYATRSEAFADKQTVFSELGETIANAMNAVLTRRALLTDSHTELGFRLDASDTVLQRFARQAGQQIEIEDVVPQADGDTRLFFLTSSEEPDAVRAVEQQSVAVESVSLVAKRDGSSLFEAVVTGQTLLPTMVDHGAMVRSVTVSGDEIRLDVEIPDELDVRQFVAFVKSEYDGAELISKIDRDRPLRTPTEFQYEFENRLTDRQREVLRIAYLRGFFEWPRESTGQEIADSLGVSQPTVNRHLRACERKLFTLLFEDS